MQNRNHQCQQKEESAKPDGELRQNGRRLGTEEIIGQSTAKGGTETFALGALHENGQDHQNADDHKDCYKDRHEEPHSQLVEPEPLPV